MQRYISQRTEVLIIAQLSNVAAEDSIAKHFIYLSTRNTKNLKTELRT